MNSAQKMCTRCQCLFHDLKGFVSIFIVGVFVGFYWTAHDIIHRNIFCFDWITLTNAVSLIISESFLFWLKRTFVFLFMQVYFHKCSLYVTLKPSGETTAALAWHCCVLWLFGGLSGTELHLEKTKISFWGKMTFVFYTVVVFQWIIYPQMVLNKFSKELGVG